MSRPASRRALLGGLAALPALTVPVLAATDPHVAYRERLHVAYAEKRLARPIDNDATPYSVEDDACTLVFRKAWRLADEVLKLPAPTTLAGLGVLALAGAIHMEGMASLCDGMKFEDDDRMVVVLRAILAVTGEPLPDGWAGWGDEPGHFEADCAFLESGTGQLPAWALAEAREGRA